MSEQVKTQWRNWLSKHPEWVGPIAEFLKGRPEIVCQEAFWHDLCNVLVPFYVKGGHANV